MSRLAVILLEQHAQFERRPLSAIAQERRGGVMLAIDFLTADGRAAQSRLSPYALRTALPLQPGEAALAGGGNKLPSRTGARAWRIFETDEATAIAGDD